MKKLYVMLWFAFACLVATNPVSAFVRGGLSGPVAAPSFTGFLDTYSANGATWFVSTYKGANAYSGNYGTVRRASDGFTQTIGFLSTGVADVSTFNSFCNGTLCYLTSWVDQVNGVNATQATNANQPRVFVDANNVLAVCPQPATWMTTTASSLVNTAKQHFFAVALPGFADNQHSPPGLPTIVTTGTVTSGSGTITAMASQVGLSTVTGGNNQGTVPGVKDSAGFLPNGTTLPGGTAGATSFSALPTGTTASLTFDPGNLSPTGTQAGDTLTFTNSVISGAWLVNGPAGTYWPTVAYWGVGMGSQTGANSNPYDGPSDWNGPRNGDDLYVMGTVGQGMRGQWGVYDYDTFTNNLSYNAVALGNNGSTCSGGCTQPANANITYTTSVGMTLFTDPSHNAGEQTSNACFETMALFPATQTQRVAMAQTLMAQDTITNAAFSAPTTSDGFTMSGIYQTWREWGTTGSNSLFGNAVYGPDTYGMTWANQSGGYSWPGVAMATNINNGTTMWRFITKTGESDTTITLQERDEVCAFPSCQTSGLNGNGAIAPGSHASIAFQFEFEAIPDQSADWCYAAQVHTQNIAVPDLATIDCTNNQLRVWVNCCDSGSSPAAQPCGAAITLTPGTVYAVEWEIFWSGGSHNTDTFVSHMSANGSPLTQNCSLGPAALFSTDTGAFAKMGTYRGFPNSNQGTVIQRVMNYQWSNTANAFAGFITTQTALPTHP